LTIPFLAAFGVNPFAVRFLSVVIGILTIPLTYRWVSTMFSAAPTRYYLALLASAGLAFSFWHIALSRSGFRASLLLLLYVLMAYFFWRGWQRQSAGSFAVAGVVLGLAQYTYWSAALLPFQFGLFALLWTFWQLRHQPVVQAYRAYSIRRVWLWIGVMAASALIIFIPLGILFIRTPLVLQYVSQSSIIDKIANDDQLSWPRHLINSMRIYVDGPAELWQGQIRQGLSFDWLALIGFWIGLIVAFSRRHQPAYLFILTGFIVLWLPVPLNDIDFSDLRLPAMLPVHHAISNLRAAGILPIYYTIVAIGLLTATQWLGQKISIRKATTAGLAAFLLVFVISGPLNSYNFLVRWPGQPLLYERYNGPVLDLAQELVRESQTKDILLPFQLYTQPTVQLLFDSIFAESDVPPAVIAGRQAILVTTAKAPFVNYVWLSRTGEGSGTAYLTAPQRTEALLNLSSKPSLRTFELAAPLLITAKTALIPSLEAVQPRLTGWTVPNPVNYGWNDVVRLVGYELTPGHPRPGDSLQLTLYWQNLTDQPLTHDIFIHVIDSQGHGVGQVDNVMLSDGHRWRVGQLTPTQHTIRPGDQLDPGAYLIRLGLFNTRTGDRLGVVAADGVSLGDEVLLGLFYVIEDDGQNLSNPDQPTTAIYATLGEAVEFLGLDLPPEQVVNLKQPDQITISPRLYWRATQAVDANYTIFVQLLDEENRLIAGYDSQPLNGNYPTSRWQLDEVVIQTMALSLPQPIEPGNYRLMTGMYELQTGERLFARDRAGQPLTDNLVTVSNVRVFTNTIMFYEP
jgi:hypothetical protein